MVTGMPIKKDYVFRIMLGLVLFELFQANEKYSIRHQIYARWMVKVWDNREVRLLQWNTNTYVTARIKFLVKCDARWLAEVDTAWLSLNFFLSVASRAT